MRTPTLQYLYLQKPVTLVVIICILSVLPWMGLGDFSTKGEPREVAVATAMLESGNWVLPQVAGRGPRIGLSAAVGTLADGGRVSATGIHIRIYRPFAFRFGVHCLNRVYAAFLRETAAVPTGIHHDVAAHHLHRNPSGSHVHASGYAADSPHCHRAYPPFPLGRQIGAERIARRHPAVIGMRGADERTRRACLAAIRLRGLSFRASQICLPDDFQSVALCCRLLFIPAFPVVHRRVERGRRSVYQRHLVGLFLRQQTWDWIQFRDTRHRFHALDALLLFLPVRDETA